MDKIVKVKAVLMNGMQIEFEVELPRERHDVDDEAIVSYATHAFFVALRDGGIGVAGLRAGRVLVPVTLERIEVLR